MGTSEVIDVDVVVVGARCAGAALARLLAEQGMRVVAIDRASFPSDTVSTHSIAWHGTVLPDHWGLLDPLRATGAPNGQVMGAKLGSLELELPAPAGSHGWIAPRRTVFDSLLVDAARAAGAHVWEETTLRG